jgi:PEP-CTERM motif
MMRNQIFLTLSLVVVSVALAGTARATILTFAMNSSGAVPANNSDLDVPYGSNVTAANIIGATDGGEGFTPNIALVWAPTGGTVANAPDKDILEFHSADTFAGFTVPVLQLDVDLSNHTVLPAHPTVDFVPDAGYAVSIYDLRIGNATDQTASETPHPWTISILELPGLTPTGTSYTTSAFSAGDIETATFDFTGDPGVSYRMLFDDGDLSCTTSACHSVRTAIDNVRFGQVSVPEPSTLALVALCGLGLLGTSRRESL